MKGRLVQLELGWRSVGLEGRLEAEARKVEGMEVALCNQLDQQNQELINA